MGAAVMLRWADESMPDGYRQARYATVAEAYAQAQAELTAGRQLLGLYDEDGTRIRTLTDLRKNLRGR